MYTIPQSRARWMPIIAVLLVITPYVTGCTGESTTAQDTSTTNTGSTTTATVATTAVTTPSTTTSSSTTTSTSKRSYSLVSSSGQIIDANNLNQNSSLSFGSTGVAGRPELEGADLTPLSDTELTAMKTTTTPASRIIQESVLGFDSRFLVNPYAYPERAVALITYNGNTHCTGWLVSKDTLVTAGHCVHSGGSKGNWGAATSFKIYPGLSNGYAPYGSCAPKELYSSYGWITAADGDADIGIIKLNCSVGNSTGYFSYFVANPVDNTSITINGYPGDKANGGQNQQWGSKGTVSHSTESKIYYDNDTVGGMSGAPTWVSNNGTAWALGIHTNGESLLTPNTNAGTRISQDVFDLITAVKELP